MVRHERQIGPFPVYFDHLANLPPTARPPLLSIAGWYLRVVRRPVTLSDIAPRLVGTKAVMLDLKGNAGRLRIAYAAGLRRQLSEQPLSEVTVSGYDWRLLHDLQSVPGVRACYSANTLQRLNRLWRARNQLLIETVGLHHAIITPEVLAGFKDSGIAVYTWTVDDAERARQLIDWGIDGLISNDLGLLAALERA
jgi:glycerophosphoryl diester phosphodiesterase